MIQTNSYDDDYDYYGKNDEDDSGVEIVHE